MNKNRKKALLFTRADPAKPMIRAKVAITPSSFRDSDNSVEFVLTTEAPAEVMDWSRYEIIKEVLVSSGVVVPTGGQVPLLDSHDRSTIDNILGSVRDIHAENNTVIGRLYFADDESSKKALRKVKDGHVNSGSVGYEQVDSIYIPEKESVLHLGKTYSGPVWLTKAWRLQEFSLLAIGADRDAKARNSAEGKPGAQSAVSGQRNAGINSQEANAMKMTFNQFCRSIGIDAVALSESHRTSLELVFETYCKDLNDGAEIPLAAKERCAKIMSGSVPGETTRAAVTAEKTRAAAITALCVKHNLNNLTASLIENGDTLERAQAIILDEIAKKQQPVSRATVSIEMGETDDQKFRAAAVDGLIIRGGTSLQKAAAGHEEFRGKSLLRLAEMCLERAGISTRGMTSSQIATAALRMRGAYTIAGAAVDFASIVLDASNKSLQKGYENSERIWPLIASIGSASDFKTINRISLFEAQDLVAIAENGSYTEAVFKDGKETYALTSKGLRFTISRIAIINDDTSAFSRVPRLLGASASRTIEKAVLNLITGGMAATLMADGKALFHADHKNISTGKAFDAGALGLDMGIMMAQTGRGADGATVPAFAMPKFSLVPTSLKLSNDIICSSGSLAEGDMSSGVLNPYKTMGIIPISSPYLDLADAKRRYLLCDPNVSDSIEVSFLDGVQTPMLEEVDQTDADGRVFKVRLDVGAGVLDYRGMVTNAGQ